MSNHLVSHSYIIPPSLSQQEHEQCLLLWWLFSFFFFKKNESKQSKHNSQNNNPFAWNRQNMLNNSTWSSQFHPRIQMFCLQLEKFKTTISVLNHFTHLSAATWWTTGTQPALAGLINLCAPIPLTTNKKDELLICCVQSN